MDERSGEPKWLSAQAQEAFAVQQLDEEARVALDNYKSDGIKFGLYGGQWCAAACDLLVASADTLEEVLKGLDVYEAMDSRGLTV